MTFAYPLGLLGLLAIPVIIGIHLFQRRFPVLEIAGIHLWDLDAQIKSAGRRVDRLPISRSLLLEILAAILLSVLLAQPRAAHSNELRHWIVILDDSASMMAVASDGKTFAQRAVDEIENRIKSSPRGSRLTIVLTGQRPTIFAGPQILWEDAAESLRNWQPGQKKHDFASAVDLAEQLSAGTGSLLFITDRVPTNPESYPQQLEMLAVGERLSNLAIESPRWNFDSQSSTGELFLVVRNYSDEPVQGTIVGRSGNTQVFADSVNLSPMAALPVKTELAGGLGQIEIQVQASNDHLPTDSTVTLIEPRVRMLTVAVDLPDRELSDRLVRRVIAATPDTQFGSIENAHLVICGADSPPPERSDQWQLRMGPVNSMEAARKEASRTFGPYLLEKRNRLVDGIVLGGVIWGGIQQNELPISPLISAGDTPLYGRIVDSLTPAYLLNIDLQVSNLGEHYDFPILISNLIEARREALPGLKRWNYPVDERIRFRLDEATLNTVTEDNSLTLDFGGQRRPLAPGNFVEIPPVDEPGVYGIMAGEKQIDRFAINFSDRAESDLRDRQPGIVEAGQPGDGQILLAERSITWPAIVLLCAVMIVAIADWFVLRPRSSVSESR